MAAWSSFDVHSLLEWSLAMFFLVSSGNLADTIGTNSVSICSGDFAKRLKTANVALNSIMQLLEAS